MKFTAKITLIASGLAVLFAVSFAVWGRGIETWLQPENCATWLKSMQSWGWLIGILLLVSDIFLPIPATAVMMALGAVYGVAAGACFSLIGSAGAGIIGYAAARLCGRGAARWLASEAELQKFQGLFDQWGGGAIIVSRMLPIMPEVMTILAGLANMQFPRFLSALLLGTVPTCLFFAYLGRASRDAMAAGSVAAVLVPLLLWTVWAAWARMQTAKASAPRPAVRVSH